jgi:hypothetical protein
MKLLWSPKNLRAKARSPSLWQLALYGMLFGLLPFGRLAGPITQRMLASDPGSPMGDFALSQLDPTNPYVQAFLNPAAIGESIVSNPVVTEPAAAAIAETMNLATFMDARTQPLTSTGQFTDWMVPGFQANWGPGMELPSSFNYMMTHDWANFTPAMVLPEDFASPFNVPAEWPAGYPPGYSETGILN